MSAGVFYKRLSDPIFLFTTDNELGGQDVQPGNGDAGTIRGVEVALQQQLRFLPAPFDGLGVYANYTYTDSEATLPGGREARLQGQADHVFNTAVSYERGVFSGQVSLNYHDNYVGEYGGDEGTVEEELEDVYIDRHMQLDASASLRTTNRSALFVELVNLTNEPFKAYQGVRERPIQMEYYERWGRLGFRYSW
jgi:TonB-dependent receptor